MGKTPSKVPSAHQDIRIGPDLIDDEIRRVTRYEGWTDLVPDERSIDGGEQVADHILDTIVVRQT
jgi:hypothetical protein